MSGQPQVAGFWEFDITKVEGQELGFIPPPPSIVVNVGNNFNLLVTTSLTGSGAAAGTAPWFDPVPPVDGARITHYALNLETGAVTTLPYHVPTGPGSLLVGVNQAITGPFTTGGAAPDLGVGTYQITTHISLTTPGLTHVEAAFFVSNLMVIA